MNKLLLNCRPPTVFDVSNKDHRKAYFNFLKYSTWGRSPYQFILESGFEDVPTMCRHQLCEYYVTREFAPKNKKSKNPIPPSKGSSKLTVIKLNNNQSVD